jgi:hypothetical protein
MDDLFLWPDKGEVYNCTVVDDYPALLNPVQRRVDGDRVVLSDRAGELRIEFPAPAVLVMRSIGRGTEAQFRAATAEADAAIARVQIIDIFADIEEQTGFDTAVRTHVQAWQKRQRSALRSSHVLFAPGNKLLAMAVSVANMVIGGFLKIHTKRATFDDALRAAIKSSQRS